MNNNIATQFNRFKLAVTVEDIAKDLGKRVESLISRCPPTISVSDRCYALGRELFRAAALNGGRPVASIGDDELDSAGELEGSVLHAILLSGQLKKLHCVRNDAIEFINATAFTQTLTPEFFVENFAEPVVLYANEGQFLFDDITCVLMFYNPDDQDVCCIFSRCANGQIREFGLNRDLEKMSGTFCRGIVEADNEGETARLLVRNGDIDKASCLDDWMYNAMLFALKFVLLRQTDKQPLEVARQFKEFKDKTKERERRGYVSHQMVSLTTRYRLAMDRCRTDADVVTLDKEGKVQKSSVVTGFLRRQHYGPGNSMVKTVYIESFERQAWMNEGIRIVKVVR